MTQFEWVLVIWATLGWWTAIYYQYQNQKKNAEIILLTKLRDDWKNYAIRNSDRIKEIYDQVMNLPRIQGVIKSAKEKAEATWS